MNIEDKNGYLPDDIPMLCQETDDCKEVIVVHRKQRNQQLSEMVTEVIIIRTHTAYIASVKKSCYMKQQNHSFESACQLTSIATE